MIVEEIVEKIFHVQTPTQNELGRIFLRPQEYYESPEFKNKIFSLDKYIEWYAKNTDEGRKNGFNYYDFWEAFNIPSYVLNPFYEGKFTLLTPEEKSLLTAFEGVNHDKFYIIGTYGDDALLEESIYHELSHGLFYSNPEYKGEILEAYKTKVDEKIKTKVLGWIQNTGGYHPDVQDRAGRRLHHSRDAREHHDHAARRGRGADDLQECPGHQ